MRIDTVYFDLGLVLASPGPVFAELATRFEVGETELRSVYWHQRDSYDRGLSPLVYWGGIAELLHRELSDADLLDLAHLDQEIWSDIRPAAESLLAEVAASSASVGLLSNAPVPMIDIVPMRSWAKYLDHVVISAAVGFAKPDPEIYALAQELCGTSAIAFIDDREENVAAARAAGWAAHLWRNDADSRAWLVEIGVLGT